jgi:hypothetical protein
MGESIDGEGAVPNTVNRPGLSLPAKNLVSPPRLPIKRGALSNCLGRTPGNLSQMQRGPPDGAGL